MPDLMSRANVDEVENLRMHGDEVYAERLARELLRFGDFRIKQFRRHRAARNHAKTTSIADRRDKIAFRNPTHRPAHDCDVAAQKFRTARHKAVEFVDWKSTRLTSIH